MKNSYSDRVSTSNHLKGQFQSQLLFPVDTGRKLNAHKTFNLRPVSTGVFGS